MGEGSSFPVPMHRLGEVVCMHVCVCVLPLVTAPLPYKMNHTQMRTSVCFYKLIAKAILCKGGLVFWALL